VARQPLGLGHGLLLPEQQVQDNTPPGMLPAPPAVPQDVRVRAAGVAAGVREDGQAVEGTVGVDRGGEAGGGGVGAGRRGRGGGAGGRASGPRWRGGSPACNFFSAALAARRTSVAWTDGRPSFAAAHSAVTAVCLAASAVSTRRSSRLALQAQVQAWATAWPL